MSDLAGAVVLQRACPADQPGLIVAMGLAEPHELVQQDQIHVLQPGTFQQTPVLEATFQKAPLTQIDRIQSYLSGGSVQGAARKLPQLEVGLFQSRRVNP